MMNTEQDQTKREDCDFQGLFAEEGITRGTLTYCERKWLLQPLPLYSLSTFCWGLGEGLEEETKGRVPLLWTHLSWDHLVPLSCVLLTPIHCLMCS